MEIIGHKKILDDLKALAEKGELSHGYIFYGPSMVGKRTAALAFAHFLERGVLDAGLHGTLREAKLINLASMKALDSDTKNSIGIDAVREIKNFLWQKPEASPRRTLIIDDAEFLTTEAQNALLKVTEEPPASSLLIIVTSDIESLLPTIVSRLQKIYFGTVPVRAIEEWLARDHGIAAANAKIFAERSFGKPGLAHALATDKEFREGLAHAATFLKTSPAARKEFIKKLIEPDEFNLRTFLDALIMNLAWETPSVAQAARWHNALALYGSAADFGLNPRLQLEALLMK